MLATKEKRTPFLGNRGLRDGSVTMDKLADDVKDTINNIKGQQGEQGTSAIWDGNAEILTELEHTTGQATNRTMSQKAITDIIEGVDNVNYEEIIEGFSAIGKYYNLSLDAIGNPKDSSGYKCIKVACRPGDKFRIAGQSGSNNALRQYCFVTGTAGATPIAGSFGEKNADTRENPIIVTAPDTATYLLVNFKAYNEDTDHLWKVIETHTNGLQDEINEAVRFTEQSLTTAQQTQTLANLGITNLTTDVARLTPTLSEIVYHAQSTLSQGHSNILVPIPGDGVYRVTVWCTSNSANTSKARMFYRKSSDSTVNIYASKDIPQGVPFTLAWTRHDDYDTLQITMTGSPSESFDALVEKVDTPLAKQQNNKTVLIFGDSISQVDAQNAGTSQRDSMRWSDWMRCLKPGVTAINVAMGGTRYAQRKPSLSLTPSLAQAWAAVDIVNIVKAVCSGNFDYQDAAVPVIAQPTSQGGAGKDFSGQIARAKAVNLNKVTDIVLMAGTNDWVASDSDIPTYLGTVDGTDVQTTLGALNTIITDLLTAAPHAKLHIFTPTVRYKGSTYTDPYWSDTYHNAENKSLPDYVEGILAVAKKRHQRCIDLYNGLGWDKANFWNFFPATDGTHPLYGLDRIAELVTKEIFVL